MAKYNKSAESISSNLLLWDVPNTETSIHNVEKITFHPINSIDNSDTIEFDIPGYQGLMLDEVDLVVKFNILTDKEKDPAENAQVSPVNNFIHALWEYAEVRVNGYNIEQSMSQSYNIRTFFDTCLNSDPDRADYLWGTEMFIMDQGKSKVDNECEWAFDDDTASPARVALNPSSTIRALRVAEGKDVVLISKLNSPIFLQDKSLPTNLPISITLTRNKEAYCLIHEESDNYIINLKQVTLQCSFSRPTTPILRIINEKIEKEPAIFDCPRGELATYTIPSGVTSFTIPDVYRGYLPKWTAVFVQHRECFRAKSHRNPYAFNTFKSAEWILDNNNYFPEGLEVVDTDEPALFLDQIYKSLGYGTRGACLLTSKNFNGHFMLCAALTPDRTAHKHLNLQRMMNAKLEVDLGYKSKDSHVLVIYSIWDRYISIDGNRKVSAQ